MTDWLELAACKGEPSEMFFDPRRSALAAGICARCPVRRQCLDDAMDFERRVAIHGRRSGIYGGKTPAQRDKIERERRAEIGGYARTCKECGADCVVPTSQALLCSRECKLRAARRRKAERGAA